MDSRGIPLVVATHANNTPRHSPPVNKKKPSSKFLLGSLKNETSLLEAYDSFSDDCFNANFPKKNVFYPTRNQTTIRLDSNFSPVKWKQKRRVKPKSPAKLESCPPFSPTTDFSSRNVAGDYPHMFQNSHLFNPFQISPHGPSGVPPLVHDPFNSIIQQKTSIQSFTSSQTRSFSSPTSAPQFSQAVTNDPKLSLISPLDSNHIYSLSSDQLLIKQHSSLPTVTHSTVSALKDSIQPIVEDSDELTVENSLETAVKEPFEPAVKDSVKDLVEPSVKHAPLINNETSTKPTVHSIDSLVTYSPLINENSRHKQTEKDQRFVTKDTTPLVAMQPLVAKETEPTVPIEPEKMLLEPNTTIEPVFTKEIESNMTVQHIFDEKTSTKSMVTEEIESSIAIEPIVSEKTSTEPNTMIESVVTSEIESTTTTGPVVSEKPGSSATIEPIVIKEIESNTITEPVATKEIEYVVTKETLAESKIMILPKPITTKEHQASKETPTEPTITDEVCVESFVNDKKVAIIEERVAVLYNKENVSPVNDIIVPTPILKSRDQESLAIKNDMNTTACLPKPIMTVGPLYSGTRLFIEAAMAKDSVSRNDSTVVVNTSTVESVRSSALPKQEKPEIESTKSLHIGSTEKQDKPERTRQTRKSSRKVVSAKKEQPIDQSASEKSKPKKLPVEANGQQTNDSKYPKRKTRAQAAADALASRSVVEKKKVIQPITRKSRRNTLSETTKTPRTPRITKPRENKRTNLRARKSKKESKLGESVEPKKPEMENLKAEKPMQEELTMDRPENLYTKDIDVKKSTKDPKKVSDTTIISEMVASKTMYDNETVFMGSALSEEMSISVIDESMPLNFLETNTNITDQSSQDNEEGENDEQVMNQVQEWMMKQPEEQERKDGFLDKNEEDYGSNSSRDQQTEDIESITANERDVRIQGEIDLINKQFPQLKKYYTLLDRAGRGTFSKVYKATDRLCKNYMPWTLQKKLEKSFEGDHHVAIKLIYGISSPKRVGNEISCLADLRGAPCITPMITAFRHEDVTYLVLPYIEFDHFEDIYQDMSLLDLKYYISEMFIGLKHVHQKGIIHRDVKPGNFLYNRKTKVGYLGDFGLAQRTIHPEIHSTSNLKAKVDPIYSQKQDGPAGYFINDKRKYISVDRSGTRSFRAPEIYLNSLRQTTAMDIWAVGVILLSFLTNLYPYFDPEDSAAGIVELMTTFGVKQVDAFANFYGRNIRTNIPDMPEDPIDMDDLCRFFNNEAIEKWNINDYLLAVDLTRNCLQLIDSKRPTAVEALKHPFLKEVMQSKVI